MSAPWMAEHPVERTLAAALLAEQFPDVPHEQLVHLGHGWDNDVWRAGEHVFRFPRRAEGVRLLAVEARVLPRLAPRLTMPIPTPTCFGVSSPRFPHAFLGYDYLPGTTGERAGLDVDARAALAPDLGAFLRTLHDIDPAPLDLPECEGAGRLQRLASTARKLLPRLEAITDAERRRIEALLDDPPPDAPDAHRTIHGDMHVRHVLVDDQDRTTGILDWGDVQHGDPATDLSLAWTLLPSARRSVLLQAYGGMDAPTADRARAEAVIRYGLIMQAAATDMGDKALLAESRISLRNALGDD